MPGCRSGGFGRLAQGAVGLRLKDDRTKMRASDVVDQQGRQRSGLAGPAGARDQDMASGTRAAPADQRQLVATGAAERKPIGHRPGRPLPAAGATMAKAVKQPPPLLRQDSAVASRSAIFELAIDAETEYPYNKTERPRPTRVLPIRSGSSPSLASSAAKTQKRQRIATPQLHASRRRRR